VLSLRTPALDTARQRTRSVSTAIRPTQGSPLGTIRAGRRAWNNASAHPRRSRTARRARSGLRSGRTPSTQSDRCSRLLVTPTRRSPSPRWDEPSGFGTCDHRAPQKRGPIADFGPQVCLVLYRTTPKKPAHLQAFSSRGDRALSLQISPLWLSSWLRSGGPAPDERRQCRRPA
jgi:hypothetical protein